MTNSIRSPAISTPRPREEARPSPERLEAQMRQLSVQRESELQAMARIVEASRSNDSSIRNELQYVKVHLVTMIFSCGYNFLCRILWGISPGTCKATSGR